MLEKKIPSIRYHIKLVYSFLLRCCCCLDRNSTIELKLHTFLACVFHKKKDAIKKNDNNNNFRPFKRKKHSALKKILHNNDDDDDDDQESQCKIGPFWTSI